ncbi:MAG TPA: chemotaxis protein CheD [Candidatus Hydrogenedentes bacterium]|nr:chemotaxis protein CheD [Candidatus Hydrogenedentota bacterium]
MQHTVGISELKISTDPEDVIITYSLGSCVGLSLYDPEARVGGMIHCMLPLSKIDPAKAASNPAMFTDTGVVLLIQTMLDAGASIKRLVAKVAGASQLMDQTDTFKIGERNYVVLRKVLWKNNILIAAEDVGGAVARTMALYMTNGKTTVRKKGEEIELA